MKIFLEFQVWNIWLLLVTGIVVFIIVSKHWNKFTLNLEGQLMKTDIFRIEIVPPSICNLKKLRGLYLSLNQIHKIPEALSRCINLQECYLDNNLISTIPNSLTHLPMLNIISLANNNLGKQNLILYLLEKYNLLQWPCQPFPGCPVPD